MPNFSTTSLSRLYTCDPKLILICEEAIKYVDFTIVYGHRNEVEQNKAFLEKKSTKRWPNSKHNTSPSQAVDVAPYYIGVGLDWNDLPAFGRLAGYLQAIADRKGIKIRWGADWDGDWRTAGHDPGERFIDGPHIELVI